MTVGSKRADRGIDKETDNGASTAKSSEESSGRSSRGRRPSVSMRHVRDGSAFVRNKIAGIVWLVATLCAAVLAIGALLVALDANPANPVYQWFTDAAESLAGPLNNLFQIQDEAKKTLVNWGVAAAAYLVVGRLVQRIVRA